MFYFVFCLSVLSAFEQTVFLYRATYFNDLLFIDNMFLKSVITKPFRDRRFGIHSATVLDCHPLGLLNRC